jgi:thiamine pyrophosphokinase
MKKTMSLLGPMALIQKTCIDMDFEFFILVDGGIKHKVSLPKKCTVITIGDGDSIDAHPCTPQHDFDIKLSPSKDRSDLCEAFKIISPTYNYIFLQGFLGGRTDHLFFNFFESLQFLDDVKRQSTIVNFEHQTLALSAGKYKISYTGIFSLFTNNNSTITLTGDITFKLHNELLTPRSSNGLSNYSSGEIFIDIISPILLFFIEGLYGHQSIQFNSI